MAIPGLPALTGSGTLSQLLNFAKDAGTNAARNMVSASKNSLPAYTKQTNVMSRTYIEDTILRDDICPPLVGVLNQLYVSYILSALNIDTLCANGQTVRQMLEVVSTESFDLVDAIMDKFGSSNYTFSNEDGVVDLEPATQRLPVGRLIELTMTGAVALNSYSKDVSNGSSTQNSNQRGSDRTDQDQTKDPYTETSRSDGDTYQYDKGGDYQGNTTTSGSQSKGVSAQTSHSTSVTTSDRTTTSNSTDNKTTTREGTSQSTYNFKAYIYVQLIPYVLRPEVVNGYISANFNPPLSRRWQQFRSGEISFWNDFVFTRDLIKKQADALKKDRSGVISNMMLSNYGKLWRFISGLIGLKPISHNTANSIMICSKESFVKACNETGLNFADYYQRQKYFTKTWSMIICVVDQPYGLVDMYFNGVNMKGTYTFEMLNKVGAKGQDSFNLKDIMSAFSQGMTPKF